jgi:hypothetical protein
MSENPLRDAAVFAVVANVSEQKNVNDELPMGDVLIQLFVGMAYSAMRGEHHYPRGMPVGQTQNNHTVSVPLRSCHAPDFPAR